MNDPEMLKFLHRIETHRPGIVVDSMSLAGLLSSPKERGWRLQSLARGGILYSL